MSGFSDWCLDVTFWTEQEPRMLAFCPIDLETGSVMDGLTVISDTPPDGAPVRAIVHADGQEAVETWMAAHPDILAALPSSKDSR